MIRHTRYHFKIGYLSNAQYWWNTTMKQNSQFGQALSIYKFQIIIFIPSGRFFTLLSSLCIQRNHRIYLWGNSCLKYSWYTPRVTALSYTFLPPKIKTQIKTIFFDQPLKSSLFKFPGQNKKGNFKNITFIKQVKFTEHIRGRSKMTSCKFTHILTPLPLCHVFMPNALNSWILIWLTPYPLFGWCH